MSLLDRVLSHLAGKEVASALIGGLALAAHGVSRATEDIDLLVLDRNVLAKEFWDWEEPAEIVGRRGRRVPSARSRERTSHVRLSL